MEEQELRDSGHITDGALTTDVEPPWCQSPGFTPAEERRLAFLAWLYRKGRLGEWPDALSTTAPRDESGS
jgi:hypothetical protein